MSLEEIEKALEDCFQTKYSFKRYKEALERIKRVIKIGVKEFVEVFGRDIFVD